MCGKWGLTCFDDVAQLIQQEFVVSACVQPLFHVTVELINHALHVRVLVLLDTHTNTQHATSHTQKLSTDWVNMVPRLYDLPISLEKINTL